MNFSSQNPSKEKVSGRLEKRIAGSGPVKWKCCEEEGRGMAIVVDRWWW